MSPLIKILPLLLAISLVSCAGHVRRAPVSQPKPGPERQASHAMIETGKGFLEQGLFDQAADRFQEAANVDPTNGVAFYYLALVKYRTGDYESVGDFLEKAEALLGEDREWAEKLEILRRDAGSQR